MKFVQEIITSEHEIVLLQVTKMIAYLRKMITIAISLFSQTEFR